jgi:DNA helicase-2/ATP-dependent DNA helicase PcrA
LEGLNEPQREAVTHGEGPLLILAGAGSGKTRALTHRIAFLIYTDQAQAGEILAITFTNKAAGEMRERVERLVGRATRAMWVMTFHSACARIMRAEAERLGYSRNFTIDDEADSLRMVKRGMEELEVDPKRYPPRAIRAQISGAKNKLLDAAGFQQTQGSVFEETAGDVYALYERRMLEANAMDFDDLLVRTVNVLELIEPARDRWRRAFGQVLVDEYQDTNRAQYRLLQLLAEEHRNLFVVGDDAQCLIEGTPVTMGDGSPRPIEELAEGDEVLSCYGSGDFRPARVTGVFKAWQKKGIAITTASGRRLVSTPEHMHFAGYRLGTTPQMHMTYLMWKRGVGFRVGVSRVYTDGQRKPIVGFRQRCFNETADAVWVISTHETEAEARVAETLLALRYSIPTLPFVARKRGAARGLVGNQELIHQVFAGVDSEGGGRQLLADEGLSDQHPHHQAGTFHGRRRVLTLTLCGEKRGSAPMHRISLFGEDDQGREAVEAIGLRTRPAKKNARSWRYETVFKEFGDVVRTAGDISRALDVEVRIQGRFGPAQSGRIAGNSLPCIPAGSVKPGMTVFSGDGTYDVVENVERVELDRPVYDINVEGTHNFVANGLVTHNSIYGFRHAEIRNILDFDRDFPDASTVMLEQNYRSTQTILSAANAVVANNAGRKPKALWTDLGEGEQVRVRELADEHEEARYDASEIEQLGDEGIARQEIAIFYRTNAQSRVLEDTLVRFGISYQVIGGTRFYERAEVKDALAYLTLLVNPQDTVSFSRIVNSPKRGIGQTSQGRVVAYANTIGMSVWDVAVVPEDIPGLGSAAVRALDAFMSVMERLRELAERTSVGDVLEAVLQETGYADALQAERTIEAQGRLENLQELVGVAREFDSNWEGEHGLPALAEFLQQLSLYSEQDALRDRDELVTLMTLHNAKGLEYPVVFMIGSEEGVFPHTRSIDEGNLEEERRLCYVGITRAKRKLYLSYARTRSLYGARSYNMPSRFIDEIPVELTDAEEAPEQAIWGQAPSVQAPMPFHVGDDVVHASFGEGIVTGTDAGGVVTVRFAADGSERKLMADYAPLRRK